MGSAIDPALLDLIACPCPAHARLDLTADGTRLRCTSCGRVFPIRDGIPVLLLSEALADPPAGGGTEE